MPKLVQEWEIVAAMDYAHFILSGGRAESADELPDETESLIETELLIEAHNGAGIAATDGIVLVCSPHFSNFFLPVRFELWDEIPAVSDDWDEVFQAGIDVIGGSGVAWSSPTLEPTYTHIPPPGRYAMRISGRGFVDYAHNASAEPNSTERWQIQFWPTAVLPAPTRIAAWAGPDRNRIEAWYPDRSSVPVGENRVAHAPSPREATVSIPAILAVAVGTRLATARRLGVIPHSDEESDILISMAQDLAPLLVGLTRAAALARVGVEPGLSIRFSELSGPVTAEFEVGRITAWLSDGEVKRTAAS